MSIELFSRRVRSRRTTDVITQFPVWAHNRFFVVRPRARAYAERVTEHRRSIARLVGLAVALGVLYALAPLQGDRWWVGALLGAAALAAVAPITVGRVAAVRTAATPVFAAAEAVLLVVAMVVFGFSALYLAIAHHDGQFVGLATRVDALYFTVSTLSTVGYGDIHAAGSAARIAVTVQILLDLSVIAGAVKLLLGAARRPEHN
ncbi:MAG: hypothetical protein RI900_2229 [Actinomycetota bacterium]|jgi:hypothetical protein